ncbi:MAG TPA: Gfo/Idh/MocA family oxidoreductase, partial [Candidatus Hydrogenedentes bacterium]|nr:Gfo/Idh/MocA family oxidoreductase [Candidatus Hydrogenedentota bacterium]
MKQQLNLGLIGVGRIGKVHGEHLAYRIPRARLAAISDVNLAEAKAFGGKLGIGKIEADHHALLNDPEIDAVVICSPTDLHAVMIEEAAAAGKHIFCEKPIARTLKEIDKALDAVKKAGVKLQIGFNRRFDANFARVRRAIASGEIGEPHLLHIISRDPG